MSEHRPVELAMDAEALRAYPTAIFPQAEVEIESVDAGGVWMRKRVDERHLRPGGTIAGPALMELADAAVYALILSRIGPKHLAVTTNLSINFLRKPEAGADLRARTSLLKLGSRLAIAEVWLYSAGLEDAVAHAVATYSIPPR